MLDFRPVIQDNRDYYNGLGTDDPHSLNGFRGEFDFSDHSLVPELIQTYVLYSTKYERFRQVPLDLVNQMAREIHGGEPGVAVRIIDRISEIKQERHRKIQEENDNNNNTTAYTPELTIDDWSNYGDSATLEREEKTRDE